MSVNQLDTKPEILKSWQTKLLILILCVLSFMAGWASSVSHAQKNCIKAGGLVSLHNSVTVCHFNN